HQLVCLLQTEFALQIDLGVVVYVENDRGFVAADVLTEAADEFLRSCERFLAGDLEINGRFRECPEIILGGEQRAGDPRHHPQNQRALVGTRQAVSRHMNLPAWDKDRSLYRYGWPGSKIRSPNLVSGGIIQREKLTSRRPNASAQHST